MINDHFTGIFIGLYGSFLKEIKPLRISCADIAPDMEVKDDQG